LLFTVFMSLPVLAQAATGIVFKQQVTVGDEQVKLADVAQVTGKNREQLSRFVVGRSPVPGQKRLFKAEAIVRMLQLRQIDFNWSGSRQIVVRRLGTPVTQTAMREIVTQYLDEVQSKFPRADVQFLNPHYPADFMLPVGETEHRVKPSSSRIIGSRRLSIQFVQGRRTVHTAVVSGTLAVMADVVTAVTDLERGVLLDASVLTMTPKDLGALRSPFFTIADVVGHRLKRGVRAGDVVKAQLLAVQHDVARGDVVRITIKQGGLMLNARGVAQQNGAVGDVIRVLNSRSRKQLNGRVVAPGEVQVEF